MQRDDELIPQHEPVFQISIVSRMIGLHQQTIRSYERIGLIKPHRTAGNTRLYSHADVERLRTVTRLVNDLGVNLAGVDVILRMTRQIEELQARLHEVTAQLRQTEERLAAAESGAPGGGRPGEPPQPGVWPPNQATDDGSRPR
jgi:MerR family transcriptional regulator/heat shock protein HspR